MEAFALTVIDFDGGKISALAEQLQAEGYAVNTASLSQADQQPAATTATDSAPPTGGDAPLVAEGPVQTAPEPAAASGEEAAAVEGPDNSLPFKCPACGQTFPAQLICANQHEPTQTLATADVLGGAQPDGTTTAIDGGAAAEPAATDTAATATAPAAASTPAEQPPAAAQTEQAPDPPAATAGTDWPQ